MAPTLTASYFVQTASPSTAALTTPAFTPSNGEVIVVKMETWDTSISMGSVTGGGQTYTSRVTIAPGGFRPWVGITTAVISGSPGSMTVSATPSASARYSMVVERWSGAQLAGTPAVGSADGGSGAANGTLTTTAANSVVSWTAGDSQSLNPSTRVYLNSATEDGLRDNNSGANGVGYHAYQAAASAGSQTFGLSAPTGMQWCIAGIEIQAAAGGQSVAPNGVSVPVSLGSPTAAVEATAVPDGIAAPVSLGTPTGSVQVTAAPDGVAVPVALGSPTLAWSASIGPDGIAVPVTLGSPTVGAAGLVPDGVAVPVVLGSPTLAWSATVAPDGIAVPVALGQPTVGAAPVAPNGASVPVTLGSPTLAWSAVVSPGGIAVPVALGNPTTNIPGAVVHRPNTGTVTRPDTGIITRPDTGMVSRP